MNKLLFDKYSIYHESNKFVPINKIQAIMDEYIYNKNSEVYILEAGCGSASKFIFNNKVVLHGIDISQEQLDKNKEQLDKKILGDVQTYSSDQKYDIIICWDVLEHLEKPLKALSNFFAWSKHNGLIILSVPNVTSAKGFITKFTPYWIHKLAYKYIFGFKSKPFPTYLKLSMSPSSLLNHSITNKILYSSVIEFYIRKPYKYLYNFTVNIFNILLFYKFHINFTQFYLVIQNMAK